MGTRRNESMRQRFERVTRNHHPRDSYDAEVQPTQRPPTYEHLQQEIEQILEVIDEVLEENSELPRQT
jgi:Pup-like protein